ncbi:hypothetical protein [Chryseobacterium herbae]|uniref:Uncharacterized protein n=1 Tax=Chryseobacterium herbae TaxID=2976476 RepID=A0ABT2IVR0_9FLAO|nr:hypothetical protein [Chryseobacterium sp. pc1-10]MCT2562934.1 hypothetical protein [Chryseobacterium sp. pc1-10]
MKKILPFLFLAFASLFIFSCKDDSDSDTYSRMRDVTGSFTNGNGYAFTQGIDINQTDVVLVYRAAGNAWQQIPKSIYLPNSGTLPTNRVFDYNFVFDSQNVQIRIDDQNFDLGTQMTQAEATSYLSNQRFRLVLVPAEATKNASSVDYSDYNAVVKYYHLDETKVPTTKVN